jgi:hypothetical protein
MAMIKRSDMHHIPRLHRDQRNSRSRDCRWYGRRLIHIGTLAFVLIASLAIGLPKAADGGDNLPGVDPFEGEIAKIDNEHNLEEANSSFKKGLIELEKGIINIGLSRPITTDKEDPASQRHIVEKELKTLLVCKDSCEKPKKTSSNSEKDRFNTLLETSREVDVGQCQVNCLQNFLKAVSRTEDFPSDVPDSDDNEALELQRQEAVQAVLVQNWEKARHVARQGPVDFQRVALEEGIRLTLEDYKEYGVPKGATRIVTANRNLLECTEETLVQTGDCIDEVVKDTEPPPNANPFIVLIGSFATTTGAYQCELIGAARQLGCAKDVVDRFVD